MSRQPRTQNVTTDAGEARITWVTSPAPRLVLAVGHGAGGGIEARDLKALAAALPGHGVTVALVEQPWRVAGKKVAPAPKTLDTGWRGLWPALAAPGLPVVSGGRSAGARVACRTATELGAAAVLALSFPLHPRASPRSPAPTNCSAPECPPWWCRAATTRSSKPDEFPPGPYALAEVDHGDHGFAVPKRSGATEEQTMRVVTDAVAGWIASLG